MKTKDISNAKDPDLRASQVAMRHAAELARQTAIQTNTRLIIVKDGKLTRIPPADLRVAAPHDTRKSA